MKFNWWPWAYCTIQHACCRAYHCVCACTNHPNGQSISSWPFAVKQLSGTNHQDFVSIRPPGIGTGPLSSTWKTFGSAKFYFFRSSDSSLKQISAGSAGRGTRVPPSLYWRNTPDLGGRVINLECLVYLFDLERVVVHLVHLVYLVYLDNLFNLVNLLFWLCSVVDRSDSKLSSNAACSRKFHISYPLIQYWVDWQLVILASWCHHPILNAQGNMQIYWRICDSKKDAGDGNRWWYINSAAMKWVISQ